MPEETTLPPDLDVPPPKPFCGQRDPDYPDDGVCTLEPGHPRWQDGRGGDVWDHVRLDAGGEMITGWNLPAEPLTCTVLSAHHDMCTLPFGHEGQHERHWMGQRVASWATQPAQMWNTLRIVDDAKPLRVRFIDLPPRHEERAVLSGITATVAVPGGFALVVDRFKDQADCAGQRPRWDDLGAKIGAHVVICYPGELDIVSWFDPS